jgi:hypothetical protein
MKRDMLKGLLKQLQDGLHTTEQVDAEMKALLQNLHQDIEVVLAKDENPDDPLYVVHVLSTLSLPANIQN